MFSVQFDLLDLRFPTQTLWIIDKLKINFDHNSKFTNHDFNEWALNDATSATKTSVSCLGLHTWSRKVSINISSNDTMTPLLLSASSKTKPSSFAPERETGSMAVAEAWATLKHAIEAYTGLSAATFFTVLALAVAIYYAVSGFFGEPAVVSDKRKVEAEELEPLPPPVQIGEVTEEELRAYDGSDPKKPLLMAIKGQIYDVSQSRW